MAGDRPSRRREEEFGSVRHRTEAGAVGEARNVRAVTTVASMPDIAAQIVLGEPLERSEHFRTRHSPALCNGGLGAHFPCKKRRAPRREKKSADHMSSFERVSGHTKQSVGAVGVQR